MSSFLNEIYLVLLPSNLEFLDEFEVYLRDIVKSWVQNRCEDFFQEDAELTFKTVDLPSLPIKDEKRDNILEEAALSSIGEEDSEVVTDLQKLNPEDPEIVEQSFKLSFLLETICSALRVIKIKTDTSEQVYFGVEYEELFADTIFKTAYIMRCMDFGTPDLQAISLFYPVFRELKENIRQYYQKFKQDKEEQENANTGELRHGGNPVPEG